MREGIIKLIKENVSNEKLVKHMIAVGSIMRKIAEKLGKDAEKWELVGLLHDIDYEKTKENPKLHGIEAEKIVGNILDEEAIHAIKAHNFENTGIQPETELDYALIAADQISGLIVATALVMPSKKLEEVKVKSIINSFKDKSFARGCKRELILYCEKIGIERDEFFELALNAMKEISEKLGL